MPQDHSAAFYFHNNFILLWHERKDLDRCRLGCCWRNPFYSVPLVFKFICMKPYHKLSDHPMSIKHSMSEKEYERMREEYVKIRNDRWMMYLAGVCTWIVFIAIIILAGKI